MKIVLHQNYFQTDGTYYKPLKGIAMGSPVSSTATELLLQYFEEMTIKHWLETQEIIYYKRYVDDVLIIYDSTTTDVTTITHHLNSFNKNLTFTPTSE
jgi:hypothetical protein